VVDVEVGVLVGAVVGVLVDGMGVLVAVAVLVGVCVVVDVGSEVAVAVSGGPHAVISMQAISKIAAQRTRQPIALPPHPCRKDG
jgi:hypothetical protein